MRKWHLIHVTETDFLIQMLHCSTAHSVSTQCYHTVSLIHVGDQFGHLARVHRTGRWTTSTGCLEA